MKQEDKELLLRDLCARLPYGIKCIVTKSRTEEGQKGDIGKIVCVCLEGVDCIGDEPFFSEFGNFKPYLFPLSSMTEEQKKFFKNRPIFLDSENEWVVKEDFFGNSRFTMLDDWMEVINWCYENHFDIYGLIEKGLAIDCTNLNIY